VPTAVCRGTAPTAVCRGSCTNIYLEEDAVLSNYGKIGAFLSHREMGSQDLYLHCNVNTSMLIAIVKKKLF